MGKTTNILDLNNRLEKVEKENVAQNNYNSLKNRPKINGNLLTGDKTGAQLGLAEAQDIDISFDTVNIDPTYAVSGNPWEIERFGKLRILRIRHLQSIPSGSTNIGTVSSQDIPHDAVQIKVWGSTTDSHYNIAVGTDSTISIYSYAQTATASEVLTAELVYVV